MKSIVDIFNLDGPSKIKSVKSIWSQKLFFIKNEFKTHHRVSYIHYRSKKKIYSKMDLRLFYFDVTRSAFQIKIQEHRLRSS